MSSTRTKVDENYIEEIYEEINEHIEEVQKDFNKDSEAFDNWAKAICQPKYKLVKNLIYLLEKDEITFKEKHSIFSIFYKLLSINQHVSNQLKKYNTLPKILIDYIIQYKKEYGKNDLSAVNTLSYILDIDNYKDLINSDIIGILFESLTLVRDENDLQYLIKALIDINYIYKDLEDINKNLFLQVFDKSENSNLIGEITLRLLNQEQDIINILKILFCIKSLMSKEKKGTFYTKDLEAFIDIAIRFLESMENNELRCDILDILIKVTNYEEFGIKYKIEELKDLMEECSNNDSVSKEAQEKSILIIDNLKKIG